MQAVINKMEYTDSYLTLKAIGDVDLTRRFMARSLLLFTSIVNKNPAVIKALEVAIDHANSTAAIKSQMNLDKHYRIIQGIAASSISEKQSSIDKWYYLRAVKSTLVRDMDYDHGHNAIILISKMTKGIAQKRAQKHLFIETFIKQP